MATPTIKQDQLLEQESAFIKPLLTELQKTIIGQSHMLKSLLIGVLTGGHILLEGVPGLAKTLAISSLANACNVTFKRLQFTPDMLPADIVGTMIYNPKDATFTAKPGPIFANFILADEINRAPAKVQSALLEAMQEHQVTIGDNTYALPKPFLVLATQNPLDQEGTYPLPEAQIDRFLMKVKITYPTPLEEKAILEQKNSPSSEIQKVITPEQIQAAKATLNTIYVDDKINDYVIDLVDATRHPKAHNLAKLTPLIDCGASPRASISLIKAAKANAFIEGRGFITPEDIKAIAPDVLRHRVILSFEAEAENITSDSVIANILNEVEVP